MAGSGLFSNKAAVKPHLVAGSGGLAGEIADLRADVSTTLAPMAAITVQEITNSAAADAAGLLIATSVTIAVQSYAASALLAGGKAALLAFPRNVTFTTAGATPANAPATAVVTGTDINDAALTETVTLAQTATIANGVKAFKTITSIVFAAADADGSCTVSIGFGTKFGLAKKIVSRAGLAGAVREIAAGAVVTNGTFVDAATSAPNGTYSPNTAPNGTNDYAIYYEYDPTAA